MKRGLFITLEGGEGAGKSTAMQVVGDWLSKRGHDVVVTREPGGTPTAERIRELLLDPETGSLHALSELLLMFAARNENLATLIRPALALGQAVISDRFTDASHAYQGGGRELGPEVVEALAELVHGDLQPDLTLLLDVPVALGLERIAERGGEPDRMEQNRPDFLERVRQAYLDRARREPDRFAVIDATQPVDRVADEIRRVLEARL